MPELNKPAPSFSLPDQNGIIHNLEDFRGKKVVLYFYPKDNTPGCTKQAQGYAELYDEFVKNGAVVIGISKDSVASHKKFEEKYSLPFILLSDTEIAVIEAYGVWQEKKMAGKVYMGTVRSSFLIDENGILAAAKENVKAADNPADMLKLVTGA